MAKRLTTPAFFARIQKSLPIKGLGLVVENRKLALLRYEFVEN
jgi:hypothetical protein